MKRFIDISRRILSILLCLFLLYPMHVFNVRTARGEVSVNTHIAGPLIAVDGSQISPGSVTSAQLGPDSVTTNKIKDHAVTSAKIAPGTIPPSVVSTALPVSGIGSVGDPVTIADGAIATVKMAEDLATQAELNTHAGSATAHHVATVDTNANTICAGSSVYLDGEGNCDTVNSLEDGSVTTSKVATDAISTAKILDGAVTPEKLSSPYAHPDPVRLGSGSTGSPTYSFSGATNSGMYHNGGSEVGIALGGQNKFLAIPDRLILNWDNGIQYGQASPRQTRLWPRRTEAEISSLSPAQTGDIVTASDAAKIYVSYGTGSGNWTEIGSIGSGAITTAKLAADAVTSDKLLYDTDSLYKVSGGFLSVDSGGKLDIVTGSEDYIDLNSGGGIFLDATDGGILIRNLSGNNSVTIQADSTLIKADGDNERVTLFGDGGVWLGDGDTTLVFVDETNMEIDGDLHVRDNLTVSGKLYGDGSELTGITPVIGDGDVTTAKIAADAVTSAKILNGSVTPEKLSATYLTGSGTDNWIPMWNGTGALEDSIMKDGGGCIGVNITNCSGSDMRISNILRSSFLNLDNGGSISDPTIEWSTDGDTGIYKPASDVLGLVTGGAERFRAHNSGVTITGTAAATTFSGSGASLTNIPTAALDDSAITSDKLATGAVTTSKLDSDAVITAKLLDGAVTTPKLATDSVTREKLITDAVLLNDVGSPDGDTDWSFGSYDLDWTFSNPAGAFEINVTGAYTGDAVHIHQHTGNPGSTNLLVLEADDADVIPLVIDASAASEEAVQITGQVKIVDGNQSSFKFFGTDSAGNGTWQFLSDCPAGFTEVIVVGTSASNKIGCMQQSEEGNADWDVAMDDCRDTYAGRLPYYPEYRVFARSYGGDSSDEVDGYEWMSDAYLGNQWLRCGLSTYAPSGCGVTVTSLNTDYRCFIPYTEKR